jgi:1-acyl-sn-glycerol-3-phosphate acyltransferase
VLYGLARVLIWPLTKVLYRLEMTGRENIPARGPVIVVANHSSYIDPIIAGLANRRQIHYMAKAELFEIPVLSWLIRRLNAFPVRRETADRTAIRTALDLLARGDVVLLFPEGTRYRLEGLGPIQPGAGVIAEKAGCPIVPITLIGTDMVLPDGARLPRFPKISAIVGEPMMPEANVGGPREAKEKARRLIEGAMREVEQTKRRRLGAPATSAKTSEGRP